MKSGEKINLRLPTLEELTEWITENREYHIWNKEKYDNILKNELVFKRIISGSIYCYDKTSGEGLLFPLCCLVEENIKELNNDYLINNLRSITL